jgi:probable HAF family extracellular repeat protein
VFTDRRTQRGTTSQYRAGAVVAVGVLAATLLAGSVAAVATPGRNTTMTPSVTQRALGSLPGDATGMAFDVNNHGLVVGTSTTAPSTSHAVVWRHGVVRRLPGTGGVDSAAFGVNDAGQVVGRIGSEAAWWTCGRLVRLGTLPGGTRSQAEDISEDGVIVGWSDGPAFGSVPVWWFHGRIHELALPPGRSGGSAQAISPQGRIAGSAGVSVVWVAGRPRVLPDLDGYAGGQALGVNDRGIAVGFSVSPESTTRAAVWRRGAVRALPVPEPATAGMATDVNRWNSLVGWVQTDGRTRPALWWRGRYLELGPGTGPGQALAINDHGMAVGWSDTGAVAWEIRTPS